MSIRPDRPDPVRADRFEPIDLAARTSAGKVPAWKITHRCGGAESTVCAILSMPFQVVAQPTVSIQGAPCSGVKTSVQTRASAPRTTVDDGGHR